MSLPPKLQAALDASLKRAEPSGYAAGDRVRAWGDDGPGGTVVSGEAYDGPGGPVMEVDFDEGGRRWPLLQLLVADAEGADRAGSDVHS